MNDKKIWLVLLLVIILGFAVWLIFHKSSKVNEVPIIPENEPVETIAPDAENKIDEKIQTEGMLPEEVLSETAAPVKPSENKIPQKVQKVQKSEPQTQYKVQDEESEPKSGLLFKESVSETGTYVEEVIIPKKYASKNTYKYVYTPVNYLKKQ